MTAIVEVGQRSVRLEVVAVNGYRLTVRCDCGTVKMITRSNFARTKSCGCWRKEWASSDERSAFHKRHGHTHVGRSMRVSPTYSSWCSMKSRCINPNSPRFAEWGGRGISLCDRWRTFDLFLVDMGDRPPGTTLDRIDNDRGYEPGNVRWATAREQARNRRDTRFITINGETLCAKEWSIRAGLPWSTFSNRLRRGWDGPRLLSPVVHHGWRSLVYRGQP